MPTVYFLQPEFNWTVTFIANRILFTRAEIYSLLLSRISPFNIEIGLKDTLCRDYVKWSVPTGQTCLEFTHSLILLAISYHVYSLLISTLKYMFMFLIFHPVCSIVLVSFEADFFHLTAFSAFSVYFYGFRKILLYNSMKFMKFLGWARIL